MSILKPNVFFELGIRTAINKPVALVKDDATPKVPFDTNIINNHTYSHTLTPWTLDTEIKSLSDYLRHCFEGTQTENSLWKYFSLSAKAEPLHEPSSRDEKIDFLSMQVGALRKELEKDKNDRTEPGRHSEKSIQEILFHQFIKMIRTEGATVTKAEWGGDNMEIYPNARLSSKLMANIKNLALEKGIKLKITVHKGKS